MSKVQYDIIIVGGGMVGLAMAAALAKTSLKIAVIERSNFSPIDLNSQLNTRVSAISPGNQIFLSELNAWQQLVESRVADYELMKVWDADGSGKVEFDAAELAQPKLGSIVENNNLRMALHKSLLNSANVGLIANTEIEAIETSVNKVELLIGELTSGTSSQRIIRAKLLIGADGAFSSVRQHLNISCDEMPYQQTAFVANVITEKPHQDTAWQRFTPQGPVAFLPLPEPNLCSVVWSIDNSHAEKLKSLSKKEFAVKLANAFENKLGRVDLVSDFQGFPLVKRHAQSYLADRCVLIGDAAHTIHPLAGQGVNLGFQDVACLSELISQLLAKQRDIGLKQNLRRFERQRKAENSLMQESMSGFKWLFSQQNMPLTLARNWAMTRVNNASLLKQIIIQRAMGL